MRVGVLRSLATVSGLTLASRVLGFVRQVLIAGVIGAGGNPVADAFWAAFRLPNLFRRLFAEGAFQSAFVPLFQGALAGDDPLAARAAARAFAEEVLAGLVLALGLLTGLVTMATPLFVWAIAGGFEEDPEKFALTVVYTRIMFPYLACMSAVGILSGVLNSLGRFAAFAAAPLLLNVCQIGALVLYANADLPATGAALAWATTVSGALQVAFVWIGARRQGFGLVLRRPRWTPGLSRLLRLGAPGFLSAAAIQINIVVGTNIASREPGAVSWLMNADQLYQLPLALVGVALGAVLLPGLSRRVKTGDEAGALEAVNRALEIAALLTLPAAAGFIVLAAPLCDALFRGLAGDALALFGGRGSAFTARDVEMTAAALALFAAGLPAFVAQKVFLPAFYAREDTRTPMTYALAAIALNTALALVLFPLVGFLGVAAATSLAAWAQVALLAGKLASQGRFRPDRRLAARAPRVALAVGAMAAFAIWGRGLIEPLAPIFFGRTWLATLALVVAAAAVYGAALALLGGVTVADYKRYVSRSSGSPPP